MICKSNAYSGREGRGKALIITGFEGALVSNRSQDAKLAQSAFANQIRQAQLENNYWMLCTDRGYRSFRQILPYMTLPDVLPDVLLTRGGLIYRKMHDRYRLDCSLTARTLLKKLCRSPRVAFAMRKSHSVIRSLSQRDRVILKRFKGKIRAAVSNEGLSTSLGEEIYRQAGTGGQVGISVSACRVDVVPVPQTRGIAVEIVRKRLNIEWRNTMVVGFSLSDVSMLTSDVACFSACPRNARPAVRMAVACGGGYVAAAEALAGTVSALEVGGGISPDEKAALEMNLPVESLAFKPEPAQFTSDRFEQEFRRSRVKDISLAACAALTGILVFLHLMPG